MEYGPYIKSKNKSLKIQYNILLTLIPFLIYNFILNDIKNILSIFLISITSILTNIIIDLIKTKHYKFEIKNYIYPLIISIIIYLFIPNTTPVILSIFSTVIGVTINKFFKSINPILITSLIVYFYLFITNNSTNLNYNIYILILIGTLSLIYLIINRSIKFRIALIFLSIGLLSLLIKDINIYLLLMLGIYIIPEFYSTPNLAMAGIIYAIIMSILFIILPLQYFLIFGIIMNILNKYLDLNVAFYLSKDN